MDATNPREAREAIKRTPPDLIITDLQLEDSDGLELVTELRESLTNVPVILLTGVWFDEATIDATLTSKISAYHNKTATLAELLGKVKNLLDE